MAVSLAASLPAPHLDDARVCGPKLAIRVADRVIRHCCSECRRLESLTTVPVAFVIVPPPIVGAVACLMDNPVPSALDRVECMDAELGSSPVTSSSPGADAQLKVFSHDDCASQLERRERTSVGVVLRSQLSRFDRAVRQPVMEAPAEVLPATVAPAECATNDAAGVTSCKPIVSLDASASVVLRITAQLRLSACSLARGKITEARPVPLLANENLSPSVADASQAQRIGGLGCASSSSIRCRRRSSSAAIQLWQGGAFPAIASRLVACVIGGVAYAMCARHALNPL